MISILTSDEETGHKKACHIQDRVTKQLVQKPPVDIDLKVAF